MTRTGKPQADRSRMNLLENLLVGGLRSTLSVPLESGVSFFIHSNIDQEGICLLFDLDWGGASPLIGDEEYKPDYLVLFAPNATRREELSRAAGRRQTQAPGWIATLVELKGQERKARRHGVEQLESGFKLLRRAFGEHLPTSLGVCWQGVLLTPPNGDIPREQLLRAARAGLPILPLQSNHKADLYPLVRSPIDPSRVVPPGARSRPVQDRPPLTRALVDTVREPFGRGERQGVRVDLRSSAGRLRLSLSRDQAVLEAGEPALHELVQRALAESCGADAPGSWRLASRG